MEEGQSPGERIAILTNRMTAVEQQLVGLNSKIDALVLDKARRDGAIAAGNWITRGIWAVLGAFGMWFVDQQQP